MFGRTLKARLTLLYAAVFTVFLLALALYVHASAAARGWSELDEDLARDADAFAEVVLEEYGELHRGEHGPEDWTRELHILPGVLRASVALYDAEGRTLLVTDDLRSEPPRSLPPPGGPPATRTIRVSGAEQRACYRTVNDGVHPPLVLEFMRSPADLQRHLRRQLAALVIALPVFIALAALAGYAFIRRSLRPLAEMSSLARDISAGDLSSRVPVPATEGELQSLAHTLNGMLARLSDSFERLARFTADAAHELRTPISAARLALESSLGLPEPERERAVTDALEELGELQEIVDKLLLLSRADAKRLAAGCERVELAAIARQVMSALEALAAARGMKLALTERPSLVQGDAALLRRAVHNLVENAVRYGRDGGRIDIVLHEHGVDVIDDGPGIGAEHLQRIFDRFYRVEVARSSVTGGTGLGLAVTKAVAEAHGGSVSVASSPGRTVFRLKLPMSPVPVPSATGNTA